MSILPKYLFSKRLIAYTLLAALTTALACTGAKENVQTQEPTAAQANAQARAQQERDLLRAYSLGYSYYQQKDWDSALPYFENAMDLDSRLNGGNLKYTQLYKQIGNIYREKLQHDKALEYFENGLQVRSDDLYLHRMVTYYYEQNKQIDKWLVAVQKLIPMLEDDSDKKTMMTNLKNYYRQTQDHENALKMVEQLIAMGDDSKALGDERINLIQLTGGPEAVIKEIEQAHQQSPQDQTYINQLIDIYHQNEKFDEAIAMIDKLLAIRPSDIDAIERKLEIILDDKGDEATALKILEDLSRLEADNTDYITRIANIHYSNRRLRDAAEWADKALKINPREGKAHLVIARAVQDFADQTRGDKPNFDDKLVYEIAYKRYLEAAKDPSLKQFTDRQIAYLRENLIPKSEDRFMNKGVNKPKNPKYNWLLRYDI